jgi:RNA-splicing ligase RtcB
MEQISKRLMNWASILEPNTREQAEKTASMPFIYPHLALMPDAHLGKGATVGSVIPTLGAIIPAAVGVDIGCGMLAVRTDLTAGEVRLRGDLAKLRAAIEAAIPLSAGKYNTEIYGEGTQARITELEETPGADSAEAIAPNWRLQLGSLGSGNHFIEVCADEEGFVWLFLHSGSRGVGNKLAAKHIKIAQKLCDRWWIKLPDPDLAYLVEGDHSFGNYIRDLRWAQKFALLNREEMMNRVRWCVRGWIGGAFGTTETIQCHHNYTEREKVCTTCIDILGSDSPLLSRLSADETVAKVRDFLACYRPSVHSCGGLLLRAATGVRVPAPSRVDALAHGGIRPAALAAGLEAARTRSVSESDLCACSHPDDSAFDSRSFSSKFGRDFDRPYVEGTESRTLDRALFRVLFDETPQVTCGSRHDVREVWLSRKGAIDASPGKPGLIPGSMGAASYVVTGLGNRLALNSSPHGAGRAHSRNAARRTFTRDSLDQAMQGIEWGRSDAFLDEHPEAYKSIDQVMADAADLVRVEHTLRQLVNVKGD